MTRLLIIPVCFLLLLSCGGRSTSTDKAADTSSRVSAQPDSLPSSGPVKTSFPYDLKHPDEKYKLPGSLTEISAIDVYKKSKLLCVQDEQGKVFIYDVKKGDVKQTIPFGKKGDYEGVAIVNDTIYVLSSNGTLHQILHFDSPEQNTRELKTSLNKENNTEGLCFDSLNHRLLIACKNNPGSNLKGVRAVYAFDLHTLKLSDQPVLTISLDELKQFLMKTDKEKLMTEQLKDLFDPEKGDVTFQPSDISIHPITNDLYIISTVGKLMVVLDRNGKIKLIESLDPGVFKQPEGLCFKPDGTMFISDEGRSGHGNILEFKYHP